MSAIFGHNFLSSLPYDMVFIMKICERFSSHDCFNVKRGNIFYIHMMLDEDFFSDVRAISCTFHFIFTFCYYLFIYFLIRTRDFFPLWSYFIEKEK